LAPGAAPDAIAAAEQAMGLTFPPDFRASLLLHEGQTTFGDGSAPSFPWLPGCPQLAPLRQIVSQHKEIQGLADEYPPPDAFDDGRRLRAGTYRKGRIPIAGTPWWDGDSTYIDLDPGPEGTPGQIITMVSECDFVVLGQSFEDALARWVGALESGEWTYDRDKRAEHRQGDAPHAGHPSFQFAQTSS
jgi:cell wall assembly regulator SMI1